MKRRLLSAHVVSISAILLFSLALMNSSYAAGRVFYDGFEDGTTNKWKQDDFRNRCQVVGSATDGVAGPFAGSRMARCNWNGTVAWNDPAAYETLAINSISYKNELFFRIRFRTDKNFDRPGENAVPAKVLRIFTTSPTYNDMIEVVYNEGSLSSQCVAADTQCHTYWGQSGDNTANPGGWHTIEWYFNLSSGTIKVWHDSKLVRNDSGFNLTAGTWYPLYLASNWSSPHDGTNHAYYDDIEIYSDTGVGAIGSMVDATITEAPSSQVPPPQNLRLQP